MAVDDVALRKSNLSETKKALLEKLLRKSVERLPEKPSPQRADSNLIPRRPSGSSAPLSFAQQRLWFLDQLNPRTSAYNMPTALRLSGGLSVSALDDTLLEVVRRHETLRTTFRLENGRPAQIVSSVNHIAVHYVDLSLLGGEERDRLVEVLAELETNRPFDLTVGPLFRPFLLRVSGVENVLVVTMHHIISDGWSMGVLVNEISTLYNAFALGVASPLDELPLQYPDFSAWQRKWLQGRVLEEQLSYWREHLRGAPDVIELPTDRPRPPVQSFRGDAVQFEIPPGPARGMASLCSSAGSTLFMGLLAAFQTLLFRYSGSSDVVVGSPIANRNRWEIEGLIGFFVNTLAYRADLSGNLTFHQLLDQVKETTLKAYSHQDLPFERVVEELHPDRNVSYNPIFQVGFALQNAPVEELKLRNLVFAPQRFNVTTTRFDLEFHLWDHPDRLRGFVIFATDLFDAATISRMIGHFQNLIGAVVEDRFVPVEQVEFLGEAERRQLIAEWNDTDPGFPERRLVHELAEVWAAKSPDSVSVSDGDNCLTYASLNITANQIAYHLKAMGAGVDTIVGVVMDRSVEWVTTLLGILKAGAGYACFDPSYPKDRIQYMVEDCQAPILIADHSYVQAIHDLPVTVVDLGLELDGLPFYRRDNPRIPLHPAGASYVVYTSGSTGKPKGVVTSHGSLLNLVNWHSETYNVAPGDRASQVARCAFDASIWEIWPYLASGASVLLVDEETRMSPAGLRQWLIRNEITIGWLPPALAEPIFQEPGVEQLKMRVMFSGSDRLLLCPPPGSPFEYVNAYGPTEATVVITAGTVPPENEGVSAPHIGRPLANSSVYILDGRQQPVPAGVSSELCIAGAHLARGYLFRPDLTAEKFVPDPYAGTGARMYRTGDLARYRADGNVEFLGRIDNQIKLRGFRIELGEIEAALLESPLVREAVVVANDDGGERSLVAYAVAALNESDHSQMERFERDHVSEWQKLYDQTYSQSETGDSDFNVIGWNSSYTGEPIAGDEMVEWRDSTLDEILQLEPGRVLEIGCGTGLLLLRIASSSEEYWGTDFSTVSLDYVGKQIDRLDIPPDRVKLLRKLADDFEGIPVRYFDAVILNSVIQYFPGFEYLVKVLKGAFAAVKPGGCVFVGDVRNLDLLEAFHLSVLLETASGPMTAEEARAKIQSSVAREEELLVSPRFFASLPSLVPEIESVEIHLKRGRHQNELTKYRYNAVLRIGAPGPASDVGMKLDWHRESMSPDKLRDLLASAGHESLLIRDVPNSRVIGELESLRLVKSGFDQGIGELKLRAAECASEAFDPEQICLLGEELHFRSGLYASDSFDDAFFDVLFSKPVAAGASGNSAPSRNYATYAGGETACRNLRSYVSSPLQDRIGAWLAPDLKQLLSTRLPDYMVPSSIVLLDALPRNANGKIDRKGLLRSTVDRAGSSRGYVAPVTPEEELLAGIWSRLLGVERVGTSDNFFDIGGHSLRATQVVSAVRNVFRVEIPLVEFFAEPTVAAIARKVAAARRAGTETCLPKITSAIRSDVAPLSLAQQRLWFIDQLAPGTPVYNVPLAIRIKGKISVPALSQAMSEIVRRHETLRTTFVDKDGPQQLIHSHSHVRAPICELSGLPGDELDRQSRKLASVERERPFDLRDGPLVRFALLSVGRAELSVLITMHHIVSDGWSVTVLLDEISNLYEAFSSGGPSPLDDPEIQYADFCCWQREWIDAGILDRQTAFWKENIGESPVVVELPVDKARPPMQSFTGASLLVTIPSNVASGVREFARANGATMFMVLLAAFQALLHRYTGEETIIVSTPIAGRNRTELERLIGFFVNTLILKAEVAGRTMFRDLVDQAREFALGAYSNQDVPFERLVEELHPKRDMSRNPLFQIMIALQTMPAAQSRPSGLQLRAQESDSSTARFDLEMQLLEGDRAIGGTITYATDLYEESTIERLVSHYVTLLDRAARDPNRPIEDLPLMTEVEESQLARFFYGERIRPSTFFLHELIEAQARTAPDAIAAVSREHSCSYLALGQYAERLAGALSRRGIGAEARVGVLVSRGVEMVATLLGVLKVGAAYVPLDPAYPGERISFIIRDSQISMLITERGVANAKLRGEVDSALVEDIFENECSQYYAANRSGSGEAAASASFGLPLLDRANLAYVIYTSGSTGLPKGVAIENRSAVAMLDWARAVFNPDELASALASTSICFDLSIFELFAPLSCGGTVILAENALDLSEIALTHQATLINTVPSAMAETVRDGSLPDSVMTVNLAGEQLSRELVDLIYNKSKVDRVYNLYGPTEDTTYSTFALVERSVSERPAIGRPIANSRAYVLQPGFHPAPPGVAGAIYLGGDGLARGYVGRPDLTAEVFLPEPLPSSPGSRLYNTGDVGRLGSDGQLEFLGRNDHQIKIRGFRIELGEIEASLRQHPAVQDSAVVVVPGPNSNPVVVAFIACENAPGVSATEVKSFLSFRIPAYMMPATVTVLPRLPLTANGKVNRRALEESAASQKDQLAYVPPRSKSEKLIAGVWEEMLGFKPVGVNHNFFDIGGHSLLAVRVLSRLRQATGVTIPLAAIFQAPTVNRLAEVLEGKSSIDHKSALVEIQPGGERPRLYLVPGVGGGVGDFADLARALGKDQPVWGFQLTGASGTESSIEEIANRYVREILASEPSAPPLIGGWSFGAAVAFEMARQFSSQGKAIALLVLLDMVAPSREGTESILGGANTSDDVLFAAVANEITRGAAGARAQEFEGLTRKEKLDRLVVRIKAGRELPADIPSDALSDWLSAYADRMRALSQYSPGKYAGPVVLIRARTLPADNPAFADRLASLGHALGWDRLSDSPVEVHEMEGSHFTILARPFVDELGKQLRTLIDRASGDSLRRR